MCFELPEHHRRNELMLCFVVGGPCEHAMAGEPTSRCGVECWRVFVGLVLKRTHLEPFTKHVKAERESGTPLP